MSHCVTALVFLSCCFGVPSLARAQGVETCVRVSLVGARAGEREAFEALVRSELERHASHTVVDDASCETHLSVEELELRGQRYLTGRLAGQVPHRVRVEGDALDESLDRLLRVVLHNDPVRLRGPGSRRSLSGALRRLRSEGHAIYGVEIFQRIALVQGQVLTVPGVAFRARRELARWHVGMRLGLSPRLTAPGADLTLRLAASLAVELTYFFSEDAAHSGYFATLLGLEHQWFEGPRGDDPNLRDDANSTGLAVGLRAGVELFRTTQTRMDLFAQVSLPAFVTSDEAGAVVNAWLPTLSVGSGAAF